jgi:hypothetical protein
MKTQRSFALLAALVCACGSTTSPTDASTSDALLSPSDSAADASAPDDVAPPITDGSAPSTDASPPITDASGPFADAGPLGAPEWVPVTVLTNTTCPTLNPCGGDIAGTWDVSGVCIEIPLGTALAACPGAMITRADGRARGRVVFSTAPSIARRVAESEARVDLLVPAVCAAAAGGCAALQSLLVRAAPGATCVAAASGDCQCTAQQRYTIDDGDAYTTMSNQIVSTTSNKRWDYCVEGTTLRYRDQSPSGAREPGVVSLRRR